MILWIVLFLLVVAISFILALSSMRDYQQQISQQALGDYSLFLIRKGLSLKLLDELHDDLGESGLSIVFERLFKGKKSALVVFGSKKLLTNYQDSLDLLELEDYTNVNAEMVNAWEVGIKKDGGWKVEDGKVLSKLPQFLETEQFWWQLILWVGKDNPSTKLFQSQIRAVVLSDDPTKRKNITQALQNLPKDWFFKLPKAFSNAQILDFYRKRSFTKIGPPASLPAGTAGRAGQNPAVNSEQVLQIVYLGNLAPSMESIKHQVS